MKSAGNYSLSKHIDSLTGARFIAIMIIVLSHFEFLKDYGQFGNIYWRFFHNANLGVDFFFMLSGFGMMLSSIRKDPNGTSPTGGLKGLIIFGIRHIRKIYPVYVAFLILGTPCSILIAHYDLGVSFIKALFLHTILFVYDLTLLQSLTGIMYYSHSLNGVCWFLSTMFCIYLVSPILLKVLKKRIKTVTTGLFCISLSIMISFALAILFTWIESFTKYDDLCYGSPYRRVFYVITGMLIAQIYNLLQNSLKKKALPNFILSGAFENISMVLSVIWFLSRVSFTPYLGATVYIIDMIIASCDLFSLAMGKGIISGFLSKRQLVYLGNISMYIFLSHYVFRNYIVFTIEKLHLESLPMALLEEVIILLLTMITSVQLYRFSEKAN